MATLRLPAALAVPALAVLGCTLDLPPLQLDSRSTADVTREDATINRADAADDAFMADADLAGNILQNAGCEDGTQHWDAWQADLTTVPESRSGSFACRVCPTSADDFTLDADQGTNDVASPEVGSGWRAEAWVRVVAGGPPASVILYLREWETFSHSGSASGSGRVTVDDTAWVRLQASHVVTTSGLALLDIYIAQDGGGDCLLIDDLYFGPAP